MEFNQKCAFIKMSWENMLVMKEKWALAKHLLLEVELIESEQL
jgi:hypothetical protein